MRWLVVGACLAGCQFRAGGAVGNDGGSGVPDTTPEQPPPEGPQPDCAWTYTPTNFDPCTLPAPGMIPSADQAIDTDNLGSLPAMTSTQPGGVTLVVVHLASLEVSGGWTITGSAALVLAVDGAVTIDPGATIGVSADSDDPMGCTALTGRAGAMSTNDNDGGGGGAGGAGATNSGGGGNGDGGGHGAGAAVVNGMASTLSPLQGGCPGGGGGTDNGNGTPGVGGAGGGALQISSDAAISIAGAIVADGQGATGAASAKTGAGGGGGGGAIFVEGASVHLVATGVLCADGGSGGDGGGSTSTGAPGATSPCDGLTGAQTISLGNNGGAGGDGGFAKTKGMTGATAQGGGHGGGGGGGGGGGWIRLGGPQAPMIDPGAVITPMQ